MTVGRILIIAAFLSTLGIGIVLLRVEQSRTTRRIQSLQFDQTDLNRKIWQQEMDIARLRSPQMIRERAERLGLVSANSDS